jgi:hypothetical protein
VFGRSIWRVLVNAANQITRSTGSYHTTRRQHGSQPCHAAHNTKHLVSLGDLASLMCGRKGWRVPSWLANEYTTRSDLYQKAYHSTDFGRQHLLQQSFINERKSVIKENNLQSARHGMGVKGRNGTSIRLARARSCCPSSAWDI